MRAPASRAPSNGFQTRRQRSETQSVSRRPALTPHHTCLTHDGPFPPSSLSPTMQTGPTPPAHPPHNRRMEEPCSRTPPPALTVSSPEAVGPVSAARRRRSSDKRSKMPHRNGHRCQHVALRCPPAGRLDLLRWFRPDARQTRPRCDWPAHDPKGRPPPARTWAAASLRPRCSSPLPPSTSPLCPML
jgi:hypothetical protein